MVSILPNQRTGMDVLGQAVGDGLQRAMPMMYENQKRQMGLKAIDDLQKSLKPQEGQKIDQGQVLSQLARVQALLPGFERSQFSDYVMKHAAAEAMKNAPRAGEDEMPSTPRDRSELPNVPQRKELPEFGIKGNRKDSNNFELQGKGNVPQKATTGQKEKLLDPREQLQAARELNENQRAAGSNASIDDSLQQVKAYEQDKKAHNEAVDAELAQRREGQKEYGARATNALKKVYPDAPPELEAYFQKKGEQASLNGESEADINRHLAEEAKNLGNSLKNITTSPTATRSYNKLYRALNGTYRNFDEAAEDIRRHGQPLIDAGLGDLFRREVTNLGYYPEEREIIVNPLNMGSQSAFNGLDKIRQVNPSSLSLNAFLPSPDLDPLKEALIKAKEADNNFSLVLGRKLAEEKGYDWKNYKNALNELENEGFDLTADQKNHRGELDEPPTSFLSGFLHDIGFTGR